MNIAARRTRISPTILYGNQSYHATIIRYCVIIYRRFTTNNVLGLRGVVLAGSGSRLLSSTCSFVFQTAPMRTLRYATTIVVTPRSNITRADMSSTMCGGIRTYMYGYMYHLYPVWIITLEKTRMQWHRNKGPNKMEHGATISQNSQHPECGCRPSLTAHSLASPFWLWVPTGRSIVVLRGAKNLK
jgi:hypothetical protein